MKAARGLLNGLPFTVRTAALRTLQTDANTMRTVKNSDDPEIGGEGFQWSVQTYGLDFKSPIPVGSPVFFLAGGDILNTPGAPGFVSYYINITDNAQDPSLQAQGLGSGNPTTTSLSSQTSSTQVSTVTTTPSLSSASFIGSESSSPSGDGSSSSQSSTAPASSITTSIIQISTTDQALPTTDSLNGTPSPANSASSTSTDHSNKISTGTIVAIGLGCGLGVPVISLLAWLAFRREMRIRKDEKAASAAAPPSYDAFKLNPRDPSQGQPTIAEAEAKSARLPRYELGGGVRTELPANESTVGKVR